MIAIVRRRTGIVSAYNRDPAAYDRDPAAYNCDPFDA
jgi:hypothetical protein